VCPPKESTSINGWYTNPTLPIDINISRIRLSLYGWIGWVVGPMHMPSWWQCAVAGGAELGAERRQGLLHFSLFSFCIFAVWRLTTKRFVVRLIVSARPSICRAFCYRTTFAVRTGIIHTIMALPCDYGVIVCMGCMSNKLFPVVCSCGHRSAHRQPLLAMFYTGRPLAMHSPIHMLSPLSRYVLLVRVAQRNSAQPAI
jgi:hypothetical protein